MRLSSAALLCLLATSGRAGAEPSTPAPAAATTPASALEGLIGRLRSPDAAVREAAATEFNEYVGEGLSTPDGLMALRAARAPFPPRLHAEFNDSAADLVRAAALSPRPEYILPVVEAFPQLTPLARIAALELLSGLKGRDAAQAYMEVVRRHAPSGGVPMLAIKGLQREPRHTDVFFPELFEYAVGPKLTTGIYELALIYANEGLIPAEVLKAQAPRALEAWRSFRGRVEAAQPASPKGFGWVNDAKYMEDRYGGGLLLDYFRHLPTPAVEAELRRALTKLKDYRLRGFALLSLLRQGKAVAPALMEDVTRNPATRWWVVKYLERAGKPELLPAKLRTQAALAESDLVNKLSDAAMLGRGVALQQPPDAIELMKVLTRDGGEGLGKLDFYVFRFRVNAPHHLAHLGWMGGVSGPFRHGAPPTLDALGATFSAYEKWDSMTPEEHADVETALADLRERGLPQQKAADPCVPEPSPHRCTVPLVSPACLRSSAPAATAHPGSP